MPKRKCTPSGYAVVERNGEISYGMRCARCHIHCVRFDTKGEQRRAIRDHVREKRWKR